MSKIVKTIDGHQGELLYIKDNTAFIKESNGEVWYCPKTDIIDEVSERDLFLDTIKEIVETNNWDGNKDKKIEHLQSQLDHQKVMWNELKEWLEEEIKENQVLIDPYCKEIEQVFIAGGLARLSEIQKQMQELEGEDEKN